MPSISCELGLGQLVTNIELDADYFASLMAQYGIDKIAIAETKVVVTAESIERKGKSKTAEDDILSFGSYDLNTQTVKLNMGSLMSGLDYYNKVRKNSPAEGKERDNLGSLFASRYTLHEIGHRIVHASGNDWFKEEVDYFRDIVPEKLVGRAVRKLQRRSRNPLLHELADISRETEILKAMEKPEFEHYQNSPSEAKAEEVKDRAEETWPKGYYPVRVTFPKRPHTPG